MKKMYFFIISFLIISCDCGKSEKAVKSEAVTKTVITSQPKMSLTEIIEKAYFEGQRDAINGNVCISLDSDIYIWSKSPWDSGRVPLYNPSKEDSKVLVIPNKQVKETKEVKVICPYCNSSDIKINTYGNRNRCNSCKKSFKNDNR